MRSRALLGWAVMMAVCSFAWGCGGDTRHSSGSAQGDAEGRGGSDAEGGGGETVADANGGRTGGGGDATGGEVGETGGVPATGGANSGAAPGAGGSGPSGGTGAAAVGGSGATSTGEDFIWSGYDLEMLELDESASGTPVPEGDPGNAYGRTVLGEMMPIIGLDCPDGGYGPGGPMCMEFMVCGYDCTTAADCPPVSTGTTVPQCLDPFGLERCSLPCGGSLICPDGMACVLIDTGFFCAWGSPIVQYGCPGYCSELDGPCDGRSTGDCCEGLVCAPWDQCEEGTCLRLSWPCSDETAPCCEGMACVDGYCT